MAKTQELDADLVNGLKQAKSARLYFAVVLKGGADGALIVSKQKIPPTEIAAAKKKSGGSAVLKGACFYEDGKYVFEMAKDPSATLPNALKTIAKRDAGLTIQPICRKGTNPDLLDDDVKGPATPTPTDGKQQKPQGPLPETPKYEKALQTWEQASAAALSATDKLLTALSGMEDELAQAIAGVIQKMRNDFPDTLDDALTGLAKSAKAGNSADAATFQVKSEIAIKAALAYLNNNAKTIEGCEKNPFGVNVTFRAPLTEALKQVLVNVKK
jgi:hypothetical protein